MMEPRTCHVRGDVEDWGGASQEEKERGRIACPACGKPVALFRARGTQVWQVAVHQPAPPERDG